MYCISRQLKYFVTITAPFGVIGNYVKRLLQIMAGITNCEVFTNYDVTSSLKLETSMLMKYINIHKYTFHHCRCNNT